MLRGIEEMEMQEAIHEARQGCRILNTHCENFATIEKISQSMRTFRYAQFFSMLAKFRYRSESYCA